MLFEVLREHAGAGAVRADVRAAGQVAGPTPATLQATQAGKPRVAYPTIKRLLLRTYCAVNLENLSNAIGSDTAPTVMPFFGLRAAHHGRVGQDS